MQHHRSDIGSIAALIVVRIVRRVIILRHTSLAVVHQRHMALACWRQKGPKAHIIEVILARLQHSGACRLWTTIWPEHESPRSKKQERPPVSWHGGFSRATENCPPWWLQERSPAEGLAFHQNLPQPTHCNTASLSPVLHRTCRLLNQRTAMRIWH